MNSRSGGLEFTVGSDAWFQAESGSTGWTFPLGAVRQRLGLAGDRAEKGLYGMSQSCTQHRGNLIACGLRRRPAKFFAEPTGAAGQLVQNRGSPMPGNRLDHRRRQCAPFIAFPEQFATGPGMHGIAPVPQRCENPFALHGLIAGAKSLSPDNNATLEMWFLPASSAMSTPNMRSTRFCRNTGLPSPVVPRKASLPNRTSNLGM